MFRAQRPLLLFCALLCLGIFLGSLHFFNVSSPSQSSDLSIITPHGDNIRTELGNAFSNWHFLKYGSQTQIRWLDQGGTSDALRYVLSRFISLEENSVNRDSSHLQAKSSEEISKLSKSLTSPTSLSAQQEIQGIGIDLFFGGGTTPFISLATEGLLVPQAISDSVLIDIPEKLQGIPVYSQAQGWYGVVHSGFGIVYNKKLLQKKNLPQVKHWSDLCNPLLNQWVASVDPRGSGSAHVIYEIILQRYGFEQGFKVLMQIAANSSHFTKGASGVLPMVTAGDVAYAIAIDQYAWSLMEEAGEENIGFVIPKGESVITPDPIGMLKGAPNRLIAEHFIEFLFSEECQKIWMYKPGIPGGPKTMSLNRLSVLPSLYPIPEGFSITTALPYDSGDVFISKDTVPTSDRNTSLPKNFAYSDSLTTLRWAFINDLLGLWMVDFHQDASGIWSKAQRQRQSETHFKHDKQEQQPSYPLDLSKSGLSANDLKYFEAPAAWEELQSYAQKWNDVELRNRIIAQWATMLGKN